MFQNHVFLSISDMDLYLLVAPVKQIDTQVKRF